MLKLLAEVVGVVLVVAGIGLVSVPAAFIAAGVAVIAAVEVRA
jgi:uncharacterized membrane-anchored protein YitT (DUF2179 family)